MCVRCRQQEAAADSQAAWLRALGINPYFYPEFRSAYLGRMVCPESGEVAVRGSNDRGEWDLAGRHAPAGDLAPVGADAVSADEAEVQGPDDTNAERRDVSATSRCEEES